MTDSTTKITRADAEAQVRSITRRCRGPRTQDVLAARRLVGRALRPARGAPTAQMPESIEAEIKTAASVADVVTILLEADQERLAQQVDALREPCGHDFNDVVCAGPFDGEEHAYECPKCKLMDSYRAPFFDLAEET